MIHFRTDNNFKINDVIYENRQVSGYFDISLWGIVVPQTREVFYDKKRTKTYRVEMIDKLNGLYYIDNGDRLLIRTFEDVHRHYGVVPRNKCRISYARR